MRKFVLLFGLIALILISGCVNNSAIEPKDVVIAYIIELNSNSPEELGNNFIERAEKYASGPLKEKNEESGQFLLNFKNILINKADALPKEVCKFSEEDMQIISEGCETGLAEKYSVSIENCINQIIQELTEDCEPRIKGMAVDPFLDGAFKVFTANNSILSVETEEETKDHAIVRVKYLSKFLASEEKIKNFKYFLSKNTNNNWKIYDYLDIDKNEFFSESLVAKDNTKTFDKFLIDASKSSEEGLKELENILKSQITDLLQETVAKEIED